MSTLMVFTLISMRIACKQIYLYLIFSSFHGFHTHLFTMRRQSHECWLS